MTVERGRLTNREWILVILLIVSGEYLFLENVLRYGADASVVAYISFAGTLISIVLAVLAIVYSYYQNYSQQRDSSNISTQIDVLRKTISEVRVSSGEFNAELRKINEVSDKLDQSLSMIGESRDRVSDLGSKLEALKSILEFQPDVKSSSVSGHELRPGQVRNLMENLPDGYLAMIYALYAGRNQKGKLEERYSLYHIASKKADPGESYGSASVSSLIASFVSVYSFCRALGMVRKVNDQLIFDPEVEVFIRGEIEENDFVKHEKSHAIIHQIRMRMQKESQ